MQEIEINSKIRISTCRPLISLQRIQKLKINKDVDFQVPDVPYTFVLPLCSGLPSTQKNMTPYHTRNVLEKEDDKNIKKASFFYKYSVNFICKYIYI